MSRTQLLCLFAALASLLIPARAPAAGTKIYVKIEGTKQGTFKGDVTRVAGNNYIAALGFNFEVLTPTDVSTGQPSGKRQHKPFVITKTMDATSPQVYAALVTNETLKTVTVEFTTTTTDGKELTYYTITLTNATVSDVHQHLDPTGAAGAGSSTSATEPVEDISFTFQKLEEDDNEGKTVVTDDWTL